MSFAVAALAEPGEIAGTITFKGIDTAKNKEFGYYIHFPSSKDSVLLEGIAAADSKIDFMIPEEARAVCITLVERYEKGWLRKSRCRFSLKNEAATRYGSKTSALLDEATSTTKGLVTLKIDASEFISLSENDTRTKQKWFFVDEMHDENIKEVYRDGQWYLTREPIDASIKNLHIPFWNNKKDSIPGSFFAFSAPRVKTYSKETFGEVFEKATLLLDASFSDKTLALGLAMFGMSIQYQFDRTTWSSDLVERFSSNARLDGIGDCEDIAKETMMAHHDLCTLKSEQMNPVLQNIQASARKFVCTLILCTVQRPHSSRTEGHAVAMLLPTSFFREYGATQEMNTFLCDGTYPCYPTHQWADGKDVNNRPWKYKHVVSALKYKEGEIYFCYKDHDEYGVLFEDIFPSIKPNVTYRWVSDLRHIRKQNMVNDILQSNIPVQTHTFNDRTQSVVDRFQKVQLYSENATATFNLYFPEMSLRAKALSRIDECMYGDARRSLQKHTETEVRFTSEAGKLTTVTKGEYGKVNRPSEQSTQTGHTHHSGLWFNPPTPDDVVVFITQRVYGLVLNSINNLSSPVPTTETIISPHFTYEIRDKIEEDGMISRKNREVQVRVGSSKENLVYNNLHREIKNYFKTQVNTFWGYDEKKKTFTLLNKNVLRKGKQHDAYLKTYEALGVTITSTINEDYEQICGIVKMT